MSVRGATDEDAGPRGGGQEGDRSDTGDMLRIISFCWSSRLFGEKIEAYSPACACEGHLK